MFSLSDPVLSRPKLVFPTNNRSVQIRPYVAKPTLLTTLQPLSTRGNSTKFGDCWSLRQMITMMTRDYNDKNVCSAIDCYAISITYLFIYLSYNF